MANYNRIELEKLVRAGLLVDKGLPTEAWEFDGPGEYHFSYATKTGLVTRTDRNGNEFVFGHKEKSKHKTGYLCAEMLLPYDEEVHASCSPDNIMVDLETRKIAGVQYTCYIHQIASIVADCLGLNGNTRGHIANHKDNCPLHNWLSNIETVTHQLNSWAAAVQCSIQAVPCYFKKLKDSNALYDFKYTNEISAYDIENWMNQRPEFAAEVKACAASLRDKDAENVYISTYELWGFYDYLRVNNKL